MSDTCALDGCDEPPAANDLDYCSYNHACDGEEVFRGGFVLGQIACPNDCGAVGFPPFYPCENCGYATSVEDNTPIPAGSSAREMGCTCPDSDAVPMEYDAECPIEGHAIMGRYPRLESDDE